jgi:Protein of unknown function (DUF2948)
VSPEAPVLRLRAEDTDDLAVISACLQDALVPVVDIAYLAGERSLMLVANRFCWERGGIAGPFERVLCGVRFGAVDGVTYRGFRRDETDRILALLAIRTEAAGDGGVAIHIDFAAGAGIRLRAGHIDCRARDLGEPWPTSWQPGHPEDAR